MADLTVKEKLGFFHNLRARVDPYSSWFWVGLALLTFIASAVGALPVRVVEGWYARRLYPRVSHLFKLAADAVGFSWLDVAIVLGLIILGWTIWRRRFRLLISIVAVAYLFFFWTWGINYHRVPLASKLPFDIERTRSEHIERLSRRAASEINQLYKNREGKAFLEDRVRDETSRRVARVVEVIDGSIWDAPQRVKTSVLMNPWFRAAGIDGLFNPFGHEPVIKTTLLDIERPFVIAHELGHVRGYPAEGDANMIALLATIMSDDPALQYSGWLHLWFYLRVPDLDRLIDEGPRRDIRRISERAREERIRWLSNFQAAMFDLFLKANSVEQGIQSYAQIVVLAAGTEDHWDRFR